MSLERSCSRTRPANVLVFTPTPTHPEIQGNRQRVFDMCRAMQSVGAEITLLYYSTEGVGPAAARQMRQAWGDIEVVFPRGFVHRRSFVKCCGIDDWYDDSISDSVRKLCTQTQFDACLVNYAWYSKLFEALPENVVRVIDTHDIFGGRAESFTEIGLVPEWFHTSVTQETVGLDRADFVIAIQDFEAGVLRERTRTPVRTIGFLPAAGYLPIRQRGVSDRLIAGYIGSGNPFNVASMRAFAKCLQERPDARGKLDVHVAGMVCGALDTPSHPFKLRGVVNSPVDFYESIDVAINPMLGGTGLKIKCLEALGYGKPLVATADAMTGITSDHLGHRLSDLPTMLDFLVKLADQPDVLADEAIVSRRIFDSNQRIQAQAFLSFWSELTAAIDVRRNPPEIAESAGQRK